MEVGWLCGRYDDSSYARGRWKDDNTTSLHSITEVFAAREGHALAYMDISLGFEIATDFVASNYNTLARIAMRSLCDSW